MLSISPVIKWPGEAQAHTAHTLLICSLPVQLQPQSQLRAFPSEAMLLHAAFNTFVSWSVGLCLRFYPKFVTWLYVGSEIK